MIFNRNGEMEKRERRRKRLEKFKKCVIFYFTAVSIFMRLLLGVVFELPKDRNVDTNVIFRIIQMELILTAASALKVHGRPLAQLC